MDQPRPIAVLPAQPSWPTPPPPSSLRLYTNSQAFPRRPFHANGNAKCQLYCCCPADPQKTAAVSDNARSCSGALHVTPTPSTLTPTSLPLPPSLASSSTTNGSVSGLLIIPNRHIRRTHTSDEHAGVLDLAIECNAAMVREVVRAWMDGRSMRMMFDGGGRG